MSGAQSQNARAPATRVRANMVATTVMFAVSRGLDMQRVVAAVGLSVDDLVDPDRWLPSRSVATVWNLLDEAYPGQALSLEMAREAPHRYFGPLAYGAQFSATLREALAGFVRNQVLLSDGLSIEIRESAAGATLMLSHTNDAIDNGYSAEVGMALGARVLWEVVGLGDVISRVDFADKPHGPISLYEQFFGVEVRFEQPANAIVFCSGALDRQPSSPNPQLTAFIEAHMDALREQLFSAAEAPEVQRVRDAIAHNAERAEYGADALAKQLGMSLRSLQRQLRPHNLSAREMLEQAREAHAKQLLGDGRLSIDEVAYLLGYSAERALTRAFKRWSGQTPAQWRRAVRAGM